MSLEIPITRLSFDEEAKEALVRVLASGWIGQGKRVARFEERFAAYVGSTYAVAVSSGTMALYLSLVALDLRPGSRVVCPSHSFVATANAIRLAGLIPAFVDVDPRTYNLELRDVQEAAEQDAGAILPVHQLGLPCAIRDIVEIAEKKGIPVVEDAACGLGSLYENRMAGTFGLAGCFSFHPRKALTTGEGGMVVTDDAAFARKVRALRNHGIDPEGSGTGALFPSLNGRMTDLHAELGLWGLPKVPSWVEKRRDIADRYAKAFGPLPGLFLPGDAPPARHSYQSYCLAVGETCPMTRNELASKLAEAGVSTRMGIQSIHRQPAYATQNEMRDLPITEWLEESSLFLPVFPDMSEEEIQRVIGAVVNSLGETG